MLQAIILIFVFTSAGLVYIISPNTFEPAFAVVQTCTTYFSLSTLFEKIQFPEVSSKGSFWTKFWDYTVMVIKKIGSYIPFCGKDGGSVDPSTPTPQTEVKEGSTENSEQEENNRPNISLPPLIKGVDIPSNTGTNTNTLGGTTSGTNTNTLGGTSGRVTTMPGNTPAFF